MTKPNKTKLIKFEDIDNKIINIQDNIRELESFLKKNKIKEKDARIIGVKRFNYDILGPYFMLNKLLWRLSYKNLISEDPNYIHKRLGVDTTKNTNPPGELTSQIDLFLKNNLVNSWYFQIEILFFNILLGLDKLPSKKPKFWELKKILLDETDLEDYSKNFDTISHIRNSSHNGYLHKKDDFEYIIKKTKTKFIFKEGKPVKFFTDELIELIEENIMIINQILRSEIIIKEKKIMHDLFSEQAPNYTNSDYGIFTK